MPLILGILAQGEAAPPAAAGDYDLLETEILTGSQASVTFSSLGSYSAYQHLQIRGAARSAYNTEVLDWMWIQYNATNLTNSHNLLGNGSSVTSGSSALSPEHGVFLYPTAASTFAGFQIDILDPFVTTKNKTFRALSGYAASDSNTILLSSGFLDSTTAISSITLGGWRGNILADSRFSLYGLRSA